MSAPLSDERLGEIQDRDDAKAGSAADADLRQAEADRRVLLAEVWRLRGEAATLRSKAIYADGEADRWRKIAADREPQKLARELAERTDQLAALRDEFDQFADICSQQSADRCAEQVAAEDLRAAYERLGEQSQRITEAASQFRSERDRLHDALAEALDAFPGGDERARGLRDVLATTDRSEES